MSNAAEVNESDSKKTEKKAEPREPAATLAAMKAAQRKSGPPSYEARIVRLDKLEKAVLAHKDSFVKAVSHDFGHRAKQETLLADVFTTISAIQHCREHLHEWMETEPRPVSWLFAPARAEVIPQPLGVIGIISPWNYPVDLALSPLAAAFAAGNRAMIKPSELTPKTATAMQECLAQVFDRDEVTVVIGGTDAGEAFSKLPFDHLLFTGSTRVGKAVMRAAAENLVPVTLELGGKSPAIIGPDFPLDVAATRIMHGKAFNSGQTCIAPDYVLVPRGKMSEFVEDCKAAFAKMYPTLKDNADYSSVINDRHHERLAQYVKEAKDREVKVVECNPAKEDLTGTRKMAPTLLIDPPDDLAAMGDEIFGPVLPIKPYDKLEDAIDYVNDHPRPLALYYFGYDDDGVNQVLQNTVSGGVSINECLMHFVQDDLPFGGVGASGMGHYHGKEGFDTFTKRKPVFVQSRINGAGLMRPPYGKTIDFALRFLVGK